MSIWSKDTIGGKYFLRFGDYLWLIPGMYVFSAMARRLPVTDTDFYLWLVADTVALGAMTAWFVLGREVLFRRRNTRPAPFIAVLAFGAVFGGLKGSVTGLVGLWWGLEDSFVGALEGRVIQTMLVGMWIVPAVSLLGASLDKLTRERDEAMRRRVVDQLSRPWELAHLIRQHTSPLVDTLVDSTKAGDNTATPEQVRHLVDESVRPLSATLWAQVGKNLPAYRFRHLFAVFFAGPQRPAWLGLAVWSVTTWPAMVALHTLEQANLAVLSMGIAAAFVYVIIWPISPARVITGIALHLIATGTAIATGAVIIGLVDGPGSTLLAPVTLISSWAWMFMVLINAGALQVLRDSRKEIQLELESLKPFPFEEDRFGVDDESVVVNAKLAKLLHNDVQNKLLAIAQEAETSGERIPVDSLLATLRHVGGAQEGSNLPLAKRLDDVAARWEGVITVSHQMPEALTWTSGTGVDDVIIDVVTEGLTNAVRHGLATAVTIDITATAPDTQAASLQVTVTDNGVGPRQGTPGLGTHLLDIVSPGGWSLRAGNDGGAVLRVELSGSRP